MKSLRCLNRPPELPPGAQAAGDTRCGPPVAEEGQRVDYAVEFALAERRPAQAAGWGPLPLRIRRRQAASERDEPDAFRARRLQHFPARFLAWSGRSGRGSRRAQPPPSRVGSSWSGNVCGWQGPANALETKKNSGFAPALRPWVRGVRTSRRMAGKDRLIRAGGKPPARFRCNPGFAPAHSPEVAFADRDDAPRPARALRAERPDAF